MPAIGSIELSASECQELKDVKGRRRRVVLTGAWGGGKTTFLGELQAQSPGSGVLVLPEAAPLVRRMGFDTRSPRFEEAVVSAQHALEELAELRDGPEDDRIVVSHRGSLDALAFWQLHGRSSTDFFTRIASSHADELVRYDAVLLFQTCARGAEEVYERYRLDHCRPAAEEAQRLEAFLQACWEGHPKFHQLTNDAGSWEEKSMAAHEVFGSL